VASDAYMELQTPDLIGETHDDKFGMDSATARREGAFEIASFAFTATSNRQDPDAPAPKAGGTPGMSAASGAAAAAQSQTTMPSFTIKKAVDAASAGLFQLCCLQQKIDWGVITLREQGEDPRKPWLILEFNDVFIDEFTWDVEPGAAMDEAKEQETIKFSFGTILVKYWAQKSGGGHQAIAIKGWNRQTHQPNPITDWQSEKW
jgi:type VI protein secretion system component Hcp